MLFQKPEHDAAAVSLAAMLSSYATWTPLNGIVSPARGDGRTSEARQVAMYLAHVGFELSYSRVAHAIGRDRTTVAHACHAIEDRRDDPLFDHELEVLEELLRRAPSPGLLPLRGRR